MASSGVSRAFVDVSFSMTDPANIAQRVPPFPGHGAALTPTTQRWDVVIEGVGPSGRASRTARRAYGASSSTAHAASGLAASLEQPPG